MRPARIIAAVLLAAAVAATGSYLALSTAHQPAAASTQPSTATSAPTISPATHPITPPPTTPPTNPTPSPPAACRTAQLQLRAGQEEHAMGHVYSTYGFRNRSTVACTMTGHPGVQLLDAHGVVVPIVLSLDAEPAATVLLRPGGWAFFIIGEGVLPEYNDPQPCPVASTLVVTPPNQQQALTIQPGLAPCGGRLSITAVRPDGNLAPIR
jgi:hypothetical protein